MVVKDSSRILFFKSPLLFLSLSFFSSLSLSLPFSPPSPCVTRQYTRMFYDTRFSHVSRFQFLKAYPRLPWVKIHGDFHRWENKEISPSEIKVLRHTHGNQLERDTTWEEQRKKEKRKELEEVEERETWTWGRAETNVETSTGVSTICVYTRPSRPLGIIYPLLPTSFCLLLFLLLCQSFLLLFPRFSILRLRHKLSRFMFVPTMLYHPTIISHTCHSPSLSSAILCHPSNPHTLLVPSTALSCGLL